MNHTGRFGTVSVVMGAYNAAPWIGQALESILTQTHAADEVIVVDDGSTDSTVAIAESYGGPVHCLREKHRGRPHRNRGILESKGELVAFLDADDYWQPTKLEKQLERLQQCRTTWAICDSQWLDDVSGEISAPIAERLREGDILAALFLHNFIVASTPIVARHVFEEIGKFDESPETAPVEDWDLWLRIAARYPVACVPERLVTLRLHPDSFLAATPMSQRVRSLESVVDRSAAREPERLSRLRRRALYNVYHAAAVSAFRKQHLGEARRYFMKAWRQSPTSFESVAYLAMTLLGIRASTSMANIKRRLVQGR